MESNTILSWVLGIGATVFSILIVHVLNSINQAIQGVREEVKTLNNNLVRIDRRVAYLEGRAFGKSHEEQQT